jgi:hypothetical protein
MPKTDAEIVAELRKHKTDELLDFSIKIRHRTDPQALNVRFLIVKIIANRYLFLEREPE